MSKTAKKFSTLREKMPPKARAKANAMAAQMIKELPLNELRNARNTTQESIAKILEVQQPAVAKMEKRTDMYVSTLRNYIEATGGQLRIIASFPEGDVQINQFSDIEEAK